MKKVAVLGCSHTAYDQPFHSQKLGKHDKQVKSIDWVHHMSEDNSDIEFHNYGAQGHGPLYYDLILKYIISSFPKDYYDAIIIQYTVDGRWLIPVNYQNTTEITSQQVTENYIVKRLMSTRVVATHGSFHAIGEINDKKVEEQINMASGILEKYRDQTPGLPVMYENMFMNTVNTLYAPHFQNLFYFDFLNGYQNEIRATEHERRSNIDVGLPFVKWAVSTYGEEHTVMKLLDDSMHCSPDGNRVLYYEYILNSKIGKYLKNKN